MIVEGPDLCAFTAEVEVDGYYGRKYFAAIVGTSTPYEARKTAFLAEDYLESILCLPP